MKNFTLKIADEVSSILDSYQQAVNLTGERYEAAYQEYLKNCKSDRYTPEYCRELFNGEVDRFNRELADMAAELDRKLTTAVTSARASAQAGLTQEGSSAEYFTRLNFAHTLIKDAGADITDEIAFDAIGDFRHDLKQIRRFHRTIDRQLDDRTRLISFYDKAWDKLPSGVERDEAIQAFGMGGTGFPLTFGFMYHADRVLAVLDEIVSIANGLLTHKLSESKQEYSTGDNRIEVRRVPMIGLTPAMKIAKLRALAEQVETMLGFMAQVGDFDE